MASIKLNRKYAKDIRAFEGYEKSEDDHRNLHVIAKYFQSLQKRVSLYKIVGKNYMMPFLPSADSIFCFHIETIIGNFITFENIMNNSFFGNFF